MMQVYSTRKTVRCVHGRNAEVEQQIAQLRAELLHKEQENERVQMQLAKEKEERERAERQVGAICLSIPQLVLILPDS